KATDSGADPGTNHAVVGRPGAQAPRAHLDPLGAPTQVLARRVGESTTLVQAANDLVAHQRAAAPALLRIENECTGGAERGAEQKRGHDFPPWGLSPQTQQGMC